MSAVATGSPAEPGWAIFALPPGRRDLACRELWERSLARSRRRRAATTRPARSRRAVGAALLAASLVAPAGHLAVAHEGTPAPSNAGGELRIGSRGPAVAAAQRALGIPADGIFGPQTRRSVRAFQRAHGLLVDGIVGPVTRAALGGGAGGRTSVAALQRAVGVAADGDYGPITRAAVRAFQARRGLAVDGVAGPQTLSALGLPASVTLGAERSAGPSAGGGGGGAAVAAARSKLGHPYAYGGNGPGAYDCSGLTVYAMRQAGISLPRTSYAQFGVGTAVSRSAIQAGDLVFFNASGPGASHVGIATSNATVISATTHGVMEHAISGPYWGVHYVGARRVA